MRFLSADLIFPIHCDPISAGILVLSPKGSIIDILLADSENAPDPSRIEHFNGALSPGFINAHCHLELSHMKGAVNESTGLSKFLTEIISKRDLNAEMKQECIRLADEEMWRNGIQAVGDICNTTDSLETKRGSRITYYSFIELFAFDPERSNAVIDAGRKTATRFKDAGQSATIVPHAPYSVSEKLFKAILDEQISFPGPISIHNQETESENDMFVSGAGELAETFKTFGANVSNLSLKYSSSLNYSLSHLPNETRLISVHNTFTTRDEIISANAAQRNLFWCTCPNANAYIENRSPDIEMWIEAGAKVCVGTDSLASNHQLSVLSELIRIEAGNSNLDIASLLRIATLNGANALGMSGSLGSFEKGKTPGILWLKNIDLKAKRLTDQCSVQRII